MKYYANKNKAPNKSIGAILKINIGCLDTS